MSDTFGPSDIKFFIPQATPDAQSLDLMDSTLIDRSAGGIPAYVWVKTVKKPLYGSISNTEFSALALSDSQLPFRRISGGLVRDLEHIPDIQASDGSPALNTLEGHPYTQYGYSETTPTDGTFNPLPATFGYVVRSGGKKYYLSYRLLFVRNTHPTLTLNGVTLGLVTCPTDTAFVIGVPSIPQAYSDAVPFNPSSLFLRVPHMTCDFSALRGDVLYSFSIPGDGTRSLYRSFGAGVSIHTQGDVQAAAIGNNNLLGNQMVGTLFEAGGYTALDGLAFSQLEGSSGGMVDLAPGEYMPFLLISVTPEDCRTQLDNTYTLAAFGTAASTDAEV